MWNRTPRAGQFRGWTPLVHYRTDSRHKGPDSDGNLLMAFPFFVYHGCHGPCNTNPAIPAWIMMIMIMMDHDS